jgi:DNA-binding HxlR family transcriptional regulator
MDAFRYPQFCPLARAAEVLGQRWVIPLLRELFSGPQRFSDLRRRMGGSVSTSVLAERMASLEAQGLVQRRRLAAPAGSTVYELSETGRALEPALLELTKWGVRLLGPPRGGDHAEADWMHLGLRAFAHDRATPARRFRLEVVGTDSEVATIEVAGGAEGTHVDGLEPQGGPDAEPVAGVRAPILLMMGFLSGAIPLSALQADAEVVLTGDEEALVGLPDLFDMPPPALPAPTVPAPTGSSLEPRGE